MTTRPVHAARQRLRILTRVLLLTAGGAALTIMLWQIDWREPLRLIAQVGPVLLLIPLSQLLLVALSTQAWRVVLRAGNVGRPWASLYWLRLLADSTNQLLPVAQVGGEWLRAHALGRAQVPRPLAYASVIVDMSLTVLTLVVFIGVGLGVLALRGGTLDLAGMLIGVSVFAVLLSGAVLAQRRGTLAAVVRRGARMLRVAGGHGAWRLTMMTDGALRALYGARRSLLCAAAWHCASWVGGAAQSWLALRLLGMQVGLLDALIIEAVGQAVRNAGGFIPGSLGAHEAGYVLGCTLAGLPPAPGFALPVLRRLRDLVIGLPVLLFWQLRNPGRGQRGEAFGAAKERMAS